MALPSTSNKKSRLPVPSNKTSQKKFIDILEKDHGFNIVSEIVEEIRMIKRNKRIKGLDKRRLLKDYYLTLLTFCVPKQKVVEDSPRDKKKGLIFNINVGGPSTASSSPQPAGAGKVSTKMNIDIPTVQTKDGMYYVDTDKLE